jgi:acyl carrier protein phosphodiesterase
MNFLAHLHLARPEPTSRLGNLLGDFVRGRPDERFSPLIWRGIMHHRRLDVFTDAHPSWRVSRSRLRPERVRFAGIVVDVFYDHFLSLHWERFAHEGETLEEFIRACHGDLREAGPQGPDEANLVIERMERQGWLASYASLDGIDEAIRRISRRSPKLGPMEEAIADLVGDYAGFEADFLSFYPDAIARSNALHLAAEESESEPSL